MNSALVKPVSEPGSAYSAKGTVGAVVVGGDYQGLGIVRSLGRQGIPVCVVDDELSISRYSRYSTKFVKLADLRGERVAVDSLIEIGKR
jgi:D-aspartate ligase